MWRQQAQQILWQSLPPSVAYSIDRRFYLTPVKHQKRLLLVAYDEHEEKDHGNSGDDDDDYYDGDSEG